MKICPQCHSTDVPDGANICPFCLYKFKTDVKEKGQEKALVKTPAEPSEKNAKEQNKKRKASSNKKTLLMAAIIVFIIIFGIGKIVKMKQAAYGDDEVEAVTKKPVEEAVVREEIAQVQEPKATEAPTEVPAYPYKDEFVLPDSDSRYLQEDEIYDLSLEDIRIARNEIYARHGRKFNDENLQAYFNSCSWYQGTIDPEDFTDDYAARVFNDYEMKNKDLILYVEEQKKASDKNR